MSIKTKQFETGRVAVNWTFNGKRHSKETQLTKYVVINKRFRLYSITTNISVIPISNTFANRSIRRRVSYILDKPWDERSNRPEPMSSKALRSNAYSWNNLFVDPLVKLNFCKETDTIVSECEETRRDDGISVYLYFEKNSDTYIKVFASSRYKLIDNHIL